jgi:hypothetical protein
MMHSAATWRIEQTEGYQNLKPGKGVEIIYQKKALMMWHGLQDYLWSCRA